MDEFTCEKCRARLGVFEQEDRLKCTCGAEYHVDRSKSPIQIQRSYAPRLTPTIQESKPELPKLFSPEWEDLVYPKNLVAFDSQKVREVVKAVCLLLFWGHENSRNLLLSSAQMLVFRKAATQLPEDLSLSLSLMATQNPPPVAT